MKTKKSLHLKMKQKHDHNDDLKVIVIMYLQKK